MTSQQYSVNDYPIQKILSLIRFKEIAIPEIQRPFVWTSTKVRDFIDSLYNGYPVGYLIAWRNPSIRLKDGTPSRGKLILIDGQQRVTSLMASMLGEYTINKKYKKTRITIAFHPIEQRFQVANSAIRGDKAWLTDISILFKPETQILRVVEEYCENNAETDRYEINERIERVRGMQNNTIGFIELNEDLDIKTVSDIFVRINSKGVKLNAADFAMSKMASNENYNGSKIRRCIEYFCHLSQKPEDFRILRRDHEFSNTVYFKTMEWLKNRKEDLYIPTYTDMIRVAFTSEFKRGHLNDLIALLSGRNFQTREFEESISEDSFNRFENSILRFMNKTDFDRFIMILKSLGFVNASMIGSQNAVNFSYIIYLTLRKQGANQTLIQTLISRWFVMSILTGRYRGSVETRFSEDIRKITEQGAEKYLNEVESAELSDTFWDVGLPQLMNASVVSSPYLNVFLASQVKANDKGFLSSVHTVKTLLEGTSHRHHVVPKNFLMNHKMMQNMYNQIANLVVMQAEINISIGAEPPASYFSALRRQCETGEVRYGGIIDLGELRENLKAHCIPQEMETFEVANYDRFLKKRRKLMAEKIRDYYRSL